MSDRWNEERERAWRDRRDARYGRDDDYGSGDYERRDYALGDYESGYRSFEPPRDRAYGQERDYGRTRGRGPVFGERETGADYTNPRDYGGGGYGGRDDQTFAYRTDTRGGRYYGDDGRSRIYSGEFAAASPDDAYPAYSRDYREAYGDRDRDRHRGDGGFWDRAQRRVARWFGEYEDDDRSLRQASHRGRGPQGYKRSDERISDEAHERLTDDPYLDASGVMISVSGGEVTLSGTVTEREAKHRAERIVENLSGVSHVQNNIRVDRGNPLTGSGRGFGDSASEAQVRNAAASTDDLTLSGKGRTTQ